MFRVGDRVWSVDFGWGEVVEIYEDTKYPVNVQYSGVENNYTIDGKDREYKNRSLFFEEIHIPTSALVRQKWRAEEAEFYWYIESIGEVAVGVDRRGATSNDRYNIGNYFKTKEDAMESDIYKAFHKEVK